MAPAAGKGERQLYSQARIIVLLMQPYLKIPSNSYKLRDLERVHMHPSTKARYGWFPVSFRSANVCFSQ